MTKESKPNTISTIGEYAKNMREKRDPSNRRPGGPGRYPSSNRPPRSGFGGGGSRFSQGERRFNNEDRPRRAWDDRGPEGREPRQEGRDSRQEGRPYGQANRRPGGPGRYPSSNRPPRSGFGGGGSRFSQGERRFNNEDRPRRAWDDRGPEGREPRQEGRPYNKNEDGRNQQKQFPPSDGIRISKKLADLGVCSRRDAERAVAGGKVKINDAVVTDLAFRVKDADKIHFEDKEIPNIQPQTRVFLFNKPTGCLTTNSDPGGRKTVFDVIPAKFGRLITIGRLDYNSEGLLLLTNNGNFARSMELPSSNVQRRYKVLVRGSINQETIDSLKDGITIDGFQYRGISVRIEKEEAEEPQAGSLKENELPPEFETNEDSASLPKPDDRPQSPVEEADKELPETTEEPPLDEQEEDRQSPEQRKKVWLSVYLKEGKNREIRKIMSHCGLSVVKLIRTGYGKFNLNGIPSGCVIEYKGRVDSSKDES